MLLKQGDSGVEVKGLQRGLNRLGSLLLVDGSFGPGTRDAVADGRVALGHPGPPEADDAFQQELAALPDPFPPLTASGVTFIARAEVSSPAQYRLKYRNPIWPGGASGITIGIGYDLRFVDRARLAADWGDRLSAETIEQLGGCLGKLGSADLLGPVRGLEVGLLDAVTVFLQRLLPQYLDSTRSIYPQVDDLAAARRTALVSLVYNRGARLTDSSFKKNDRREMRKIQSLLKAGDFDAVAEQFDSMTRLWDSAKQPGLIKRRQDEASLWRDGFAALVLE